MLPLWGTVLLFIIMTHLKRTERKIYFGTQFQSTIASLWRDEAEWWRDMVEQSCCSPMADRRMQKQEGAVGKISLSSMPESKISYQVGPTSIFYHFLGML